MKKQIKKRRKGTGMNERKKKEKGKRKRKERTEENRSNYQISWKITRRAAQIGLSTSDEAQSGRYSNPNLLN